MPLQAGDRLGPYEVHSALGAGGMGEVYRARDAALGRDVAIKILPDHFVSDTDRLARFEREARTLASLNHPGIAHIYGMESAAPAGHRALVMELVEGEDLSAIIARGRLPLADALPIAKQLAQALEAAHDAGVVHRDLKPANVKVRDDGTVKVLDFGLAKAADPSGVSSASLALSPTITSPATQFGTLLGTAAYMSPEQARGKVVDRRADVWAFGVVLYEMLSGRRAFAAGELSDVLASVLKDPVDFDALPAETPAAIRRLLRRCLEKNRADRLDSMAAARLEITDAMSAVADAGDRAAAPPLSPHPKRAAPLAAVLAAGVMLGVPAGWLLLRPAPAPAARVVSFSLPIAPDVIPTAVALGASGDVVAYETDRIYVRGLADTEARALPGTEGARNLFLSPDGRWVGFYAAGKIRKIAFAGGDPLTIADVSFDTPGAAWGPNDTVLFTTGWNAPLYSVAASGGAKPIAVSTVNTGAGELGHWWPHLMPDGKTVLFTVWRAATGINDSQIAALDLGTGRHRVLMPGSYAQYLSSGHLLYFQAGRYHTVRFDPAALAATGEPVDVLPDAQLVASGGGREKPVSVARDGTLAYLAGPLVQEQTLAWMTLSGATSAIAGPPRQWGSFALAPDGGRLAGSAIEGGVPALWLRDVARGTDDGVSAPGANFSPVWSPTGDFLVFTSMRAGHFDAYRLSLNGQVSALIEEPYDQEPLEITSDGKRMLLFDYASDGSVRLTMADIDRPTARTTIQPSPATMRSARLSPDDRWLAVEDAASGRSEILVHPIPGPGAAVRVSTRGGNRPRWSSTGSKLYYQRDDALMAVTYSAANGRFAIEREDEAARLGGHTMIDVARDGRFLVSKPTPGQSRAIRIVVNWTAEMKR